MTTPLLGTHEIDGELLAAPWVMLSCALLLRALQPCAHRWQSLMVAMAAGMSGTLALLVKQNFVDGLVFAAVVLVALRLSGRGSPIRPSELFAAGALGATIPLAAATFWASTSGSGLSGLLYAVYGFRSDAVRVVLSQSMLAPVQRAQGLAVLVVDSGMLLVVLAFVFSPRGTRKDPVAVAIGVMFVTAAASVALGASYWSHYLIQFVPAVALASAQLSRSARPSLWAPRVAVTIVVVSSLVSSGGAMGASQVSSEDERSAAVVAWLSDSARPHDSLLITYGHGTIFYETGLRPSYPFVWTLPMRTLDPGLSLLRDQIGGPHAPVWLLEWSSLDA